MRYVVIALIVLLFLVGCKSQEAKDKDVFIGIYSAMQENPDAAVNDCSKIVTDQSRQICYSTYLALKAERKESIEPAFCDHFDGEMKEKCLLYASLPNGG